MMKNVAKKPTRPGDLRRGRRHGGLRRVSLSDEDFVFAGERLVMLVGGSLGRDENPEKATASTAVSVLWPIKNQCCSRWDGPS
jgi:hypothetical protein